MNNEELDRQLDDKIKALSPEVHPEKDLWPGIEYAIEMRSEKRPKWVVYGAAAALIAALGFTLMPSMKNAENPTLQTALNDMDQHYAIEKASLINYYANDVALTNNWQDQIQELAVARTAIIEALQHDPNNSFLLGMLKNTYSQELKIIESVHQKPLQEFNL